MDILNGLPQWAREDAEWRLEAFQQSLDAGDADGTFTMAQAIREIAEDVDRGDRGYTARHKRDMAAYLLSIGVNRVISESDYAERHIWTSGGRNRKASMFPKLADGRRVEFVSWGPLVDA